MLSLVSISFVFAGVFSGSDDLTSGPFDDKMAQGIGYKTGRLRQIGMATMANGENGIRILRAL
jgi:hypothetical protein